MKVPIFEIGSLIGGLIYVSKSIVSIEHLNQGDILNIIFGFLLFLSWVPIYLFYSASTELLLAISQRSDWMENEQLMFYMSFIILTPLVAKAEMSLNWFVLIKFILIIIAVKERL